LGADDWLALASLIVCVAIGIDLIIGVAIAGFGRSAYGLPSTDPLVKKTRWFTAISNWISPFGLTFAKLSLLFFYRRIFRGRYFNILSWALIVLGVIWVTGCFFIGLFQCGPHVTWLFSTTEFIAAHCMSGEALGLGYAATDVFTDLLIIIFPIYWTSRLHMSPTRRMLVNAVFLFGSLAIMASVARLVVYTQIYPNHNVDPDTLGFLTSIPYFTELEVGLAVIACCMPTYGSLLTDAQKERLTARFSRTRKTTSYGKPRNSRSKSRTLTNERDESISGAPFIPPSVLDHVKLETIATRDSDRAASQQEEGRITVQTATEQYSRPRTREDISELE